MSNRKPKPTSFPVIEPGETWTDVVKVKSAGPSAFRVLFDDSPEFKQTKAIMTHTGLLRSIQFQLESKQVPTCQCGHCLTCRQIAKDITDHLSQPEPACLWTDNGRICYDTDCGRTFEFSIGGLVTNGFKTCPFCGRAIKSKP